MNPFSYIKEVNKSAADLYSLRSDYAKFSQAMHMMMQGIWNSDYIPLEQKWIPNRLKQMCAGKDGFSLKDYAYQLGAGCGISATEFPLHAPDCQGNSWSKLNIGPFEEVKWTESPDGMAQSVKAGSLFYGADDVGICQLDRRWVYSHWYDLETKAEYPIKFSDEKGYEEIKSPTKLEDGTKVLPKEMKYVIVLIHVMDYEEFRAGPTLPEVAVTKLAYSKISLTAISLAEFIRSLGYNAIPSSNCTALNIPLAIDAGLGQMGRNAKLIHPKFGPRVRLSKVITDLPITADKPVVFGVDTFCKSCKKCAIHCPAKAIPESEPSYEPKGDYNNKGVLQWYCNHDKCRSFWTANGTNCGLCITTCPYNKGDEWIHVLPKWTAAKFPSLVPFIVWMDDLFGYGKVKNYS